MKRQHTPACQIGDNFKDCPACQELKAESRTARANPLEKVIELAVCDHAKQLGCLVYKFTSPSRRSVPDRLFIMPDGKGVFFIEFKRKWQKPTAGQEIEIAKIRAKGQRVFVIDNKDAGKTAVFTMVRLSDKAPSTNLDDY